MKKLAITVNIARTLKTTVVSEYLKELSINVILLIKISVFID